MDNRVWAEPREGGIRCQAYTDRYDWTPEAARGVVWALRQPGRRLEAGVGLLGPDTREATINAIEVALSLAESGLGRATPKSDNRRKKEKLRGRKRRVPHPVTPLADPE